MRFKKGTKIEVLSNPDLPSCSWRCAEIICGDGHNYTVRYGYEIAKMVSRTVIRPCPPPVNRVENWEIGDIVEVFDEFSWRMATIVKVMRNDYFLVKLIGSSSEFEVCKVDIRVRQCWQDGEWVAIGKASTNYVDLECKEKPTLMYNSSSRSKILQSNTKMNLCLQDKYSNAKDNIKFQESHIFSSTTLKRSSPYFVAQAAPYTRRSKKLRMVDKKKVENFTCSVDSCSSTSTKFAYRNSTCDVEYIDGHCSDAESSSNREYDLAKRKEKPGEEIHSLELHAYRCTMKALHALGPLSWEQQTLVTNLRLLLNISNDEHLLEVRNLISRENNIHVR